MPTNSPAEHPQQPPAAATTAPPADVRNVSIDEVGDEIATSWNEALARFPGASWYHRYEWRSVNERILRQRCRFLAARREGRIIGVLPLTMVASRLFGRRLCSMPFVNSGGPCAEDPAVNALLISRAIEIARHENADSLELRCMDAVDTTLPVSLRKVGLFVRLGADPEATWATYSRAHRKNVRRAAKNGLEVAAGGTELLPEFFKVMSHAWRDLGTPFYSRDYFAEIMGRFREQARIHVCRHAGRAVGASLTGHFGDTVEGLWNGSTLEGRKLDSNYVLYWEMIRDASTRGYRLFHLGRSTAGSGAIDFKLKWNAEQHPFHWYYWTPAGAAAPELNVENPKFRLAIALWRRLPVPLTRILGPPLARCIP